MRVIDFNTRDAEVYGLKVSHFALPASPGNVMACTLEPGAQSHGHNHHEHELFYFMKGRALVTNGDTTQEVGPGQAVVFGPLEAHIITNLSTTEPVEFLSVYWSADANQAAPVPATTQRPALVFSTPPTPNGDLHLGHLSGPYLAGDILRRSLLEQGRVAHHASGRDDNQTYVVVKGVKDRRTPEAVAEDFANLIQETWAMAGIEMHGFIRPDRDGPYAQFVREGIDRLMARGLIVERETDVLLDPQGRYLHEAYVQGKCPHCGEGSDGNACEACGRPNDCTDLVDPRVRFTGATPVKGRAKRLFFRLSALQDELSQYVRMAAMPAKVFDLCARMIEDGLPDIAISHPTEWGIRHTVPGHENSVIYVWFEMAFGYLWQAGEIAGSTGDRWADAARAYDGSREIIHCYGFDNAYYHTLLFPAVYIGLDMGLVPPRVHVVNELLDLDGSKFSTSRNHLIWGRDFLGQVPRDYVRFALARYRPEGVRADFNAAEAINLVNRVFAQDLRGWMQDLAGALGSDHEVPETGAWDNEQAAFLSHIEHTYHSVQRALEIDAFSPRQAAAGIEAMIAAGARFARTQAPFLRGTGAFASNHRRTAVALLAYGLLLLERCARPIVPEICQELRGFLGIDPATPVSRFLSAHHRLHVKQMPTLSKAWYAPNTAREAAE